MTRVGSVEFLRTLRYVTYVNDSGLANRLRLHCLAYAYALRTNRKLVVDWARNSYCFANYHDLFEGGPPSVGDLPILERLVFRVLKRTHRRVFTNQFLSGSHQVDSFPDVPQRVVLFHPDVHAGVQWGGRLGRYRQATLDSLVPRQEIARKAQEFSAGIGSPSVGLHIRQGDFRDIYGEDFARPDRFLAIARNIQDRMPNVSFVLATDADDATVRCFCEELPCQFRPRLNSRDDTDGIREALVDMLVLSRTDLVVSTPDSSFGGFAAFMGSKPLVRADGAWKEQFDGALRMLSSR